MPYIIPFESSIRSLLSDFTFYSSPDSHLVRPKSLSSILYPPLYPGLGNIAKSLGIDPKIKGHSFPLINFNYPINGLGLSLSGFTKKYLILPKLYSYVTFFPSVKPNSETTWFFSICMRLLS
jgi:hypothetical protein